MNIVMTGGTSGIGKAASERLVSTKGVRLAIGARRGGPTGAETLPVELGDLRAVQAFVVAVESWLDGEALDALVLNAGRMGRDVEERSADGFELTFAVNHLAHFAIARALLPRLAVDARVILTTSGTHDPERRTRLPPPRHADAKRLAHPERDVSHAPLAQAGHAYSASKLCNILTARSLVERGVVAVAFDPGPIAGTGLFRELSPSLRAGWRVAGALSSLVPGRTTASKAGRHLAGLALGSIAPPPGEVHVSLANGKLEWLPPSSLAQRDDLRDALWRDSAALVQGARG